LSARSSGLSTRGLTNINESELVIIGCGPAGATAAREAAQAGLETVVLERDAVVGAKRVCAAGLRPGFCEEFDLPRSLVHCDTPRLGLFAVAISFTPLFGQRLRKFLGDDESKFERVFIPPEVLVHELVHAARDVTCNYHRLDDDDEEELAVMIANMFSVEINRLPVTNYDEMENVTSDFSGFARRYYKENFEMIEAFYQQNKTLAQQLSYSKSAFNPLRLYMDENI